MDLTNTVTPVNVRKLKQLLDEADYDKHEVEFLVDGFTNGFDIGYEGPLDRQDTAKNIPFRDGIGDKFELWEKITKEVKAKRYAGPFDKVPFEYYLQSPIGLVPKAGSQTRQIFHLSYDFGKEEHRKSLNYHTPKEKCSVKYNDLDMAVPKAMYLLKADPDASDIWFSLSDLKSVFRILPTKRKNWNYLLMKAEDPRSPGKWVYFIDKCLPFGASISCSYFQRFSNALAHLLCFRLKKLGLNYTAIVNYLDDFLFLATTKEVCATMLKMFKALCNDLGVPVAPEKTVEPTTQIIFLGVLLDGK